MIAVPRVFSRLPRPTILWVSAGAWALAIVAQLNGTTHGLHHHSVNESGLPLWAALGLFLAVWQVHLAAMMLPSSLPMIRLFSRAAATQPGPAWARGAFLAGYAAVWTGFGAFAFAGDGALHWSVEQLPWLAERPWLIGGTVLVVAGLFQFSTLKERCLQECRYPGAYLRKYYRRGVAAAFRLGAGHGLFCLGCCWALMLVMFAVGITNVLWMAPLTLLMVYEKTGKHGRRGVVPVGIGLLTLGLLVLAHPALLPLLFPEPR